MQATLTTRTAFGQHQTRDAGLRLSAGKALRRLQATIVNGSDHPCWRKVDAAASFGSLPAREQSRLLDAGFAPRSN